ncbi:MAG: alpha/beta fold hydrolase [Paludibacterium sp.]|uniref:alpha/beta hydrolase n=1 Tax=Paludibacterium sp. TaxID=1917523 RepID=UPI0025DA056D|nr:alpha/beta fold hydrolase [Paludibacterium sp.]MBV8045847.1 alpha/beta fold hydrolase [Paludibacterium sp.]MBV8646793.1 alpha/beta fold hydrolase [Paludibacterium sp.]
MTSHTNEPVQAEDCIHLEGGRHAVLLLHGLSGSATEVMFVAKHLNRCGYTVRVPILPGHQTSVRDLANTAWQDWYRTAEAHFEQLSKRYARVSVSGLCMGSVLSLYLASQKGERVASVIAMSTTLAYDGYSMPWYSFLLPLVLYTPLKHVWSYKEGGNYGVKNPTVRRRVANAMAQKSKTFYDRTPATSVLEMRRLIRATKKRLPLISAPALILHAQEDEVASVRNADYLERHLGSAYTRKVVLDDCYHLITVDNQRDVVADEAVKFLSQQDEHARCESLISQARRSLGVGVRQAYHMAA